MTDNPATTEIQNTFREQMQAIPSGDRESAHVAADVLLRHTLKEVAVGASYGSGD